MSFQTKKKYFVVFILLLFLFTAYLGERSISLQVNNNVLDSWTGEYEFFESGEPHYFRGQLINIFKEDNEYVGVININGFQIMKNINIKVQGDEHYIDLIFEGYLGDNDFFSYNKGDLLLSFKKNESELLTYWGDITPMLYKNEQSGKVYFVKQKD